jgi:hypothetical protein
MITPLTNEILDTFSNNIDNKWIFKYHTNDGINTIETIIKIVRLYDESYIVTLDGDYITTIHSIEQFRSLYFGLTNKKLSKK